VDSPAESKSSVLLLIDCLTSGGAQRQLCHLAVGLKALGHPVSVAVYYPEYQHFKPLLQQQQIPLHELMKCSMRGMIRQIGQLMKNQRFDWLIAFLEGPSYYALLTKLCYRNFRVCVAERSSYTTIRFSLKQRLLRQLYRAADVVTTNSHAQADLLRKRYPGIASRIQTIHNCIDLSQFSTWSDGKLQRPADDHWDVDQDWLAVLAQIAPWKNLHGLIDACVVYREQFGTPPRIRWAGRDAEAHLQYVNQQKRRIVDLGLQNTIELVGVVEDVPRFLCQSSGLLHPSLREGFPNAVCEAFAVGLPVIIGDISDAQLLVGDARGILFNPHDPKTIAKALKTFVDLPPRRRKDMGTAAAAFAQSELQQDEVARKYAVIVNTR
jgi:glycosyltransferase involved in cell wall biosynthesis